MALSHIALFATSAPTDGPIIRPIGVRDQGGYLQLYGIAASAFNATVYGRLMPDAPWITLATLTPTATGEMFNSGPIDGSSFASRAYPMLPEMFIRLNSLTGTAIVVNLVE